MKEANLRTYRGLGYNGTSPVRAVGLVGDVAGDDLGVGHGLGRDELLRLRLVAEAAGATGNALGKALLGCGDGEGRCGEEHLAEERGSEHGGEGRQRRGLAGDSNGLSEQDELRAGG